MENIDRWKIAREVYDEWMKTPAGVGFREWTISKTNPNDRIINLVEEKLMALFEEGLVTLDWVGRFLSDIRVQTEKYNESK
jgi:hypothetical protein